MAIESAELLSDRVRVHYWCKRPWGSPDEVAVVEVLHEAIRTLPAPPPSLAFGRGQYRRCWEESVYIPAQNVTISLHFAEWQETDDCMMEGLIGGPYLGKLPDA
jgi:hypothetical protein